MPGRPGYSIAQFSGGMSRRLDLAASLITRPPPIFLDEPRPGDLPAGLAPVAPHDGVGLLSFGMLECRLHLLDLRR
jgi:hypothetical protein